jgi:hypothetical protein
LATPWRSLFLDPHELSGEIDLAIVIISFFTVPVYPPSFVSPLVFLSIGSLLEFGVIQG